MGQKRMVYNKKRDSNSLVPGHYFLFDWVKPYIKKKKILDIGCWTGPLEELFSKIECDVVGIDIESKPLATARKKFPQYKFVKANIEQELPFKNDEFDVVTYFMVIEHIPVNSELDAFKNINKVLKKNGMLFMNTMHNNVLSNLLDPAYFFGHRHYSRMKLESLLNESGFKVLDVNYNAGIFTTMHMFMLYFCKHILRIGEPRNILFDRLMELDYKNRGFIEIDIKAKKMKDM